MQTKFWTNLKKKSNCPAIFSVGDEPKDKLPNTETVAFFDKTGYEVYSTNPVYGVADHFKVSQNRLVATSVSTALNSFSVLNKRYSIATIQSKFEGEHTFKIL